MPIDKGLYQAPQGLEAIVGNDQPDIEIQIEDPEAVHIGIDGVEIDIEKGENEDEFNANLAEEMNPGDLQELAGDLEASINDDKSARKDWEDMYKDGITLLGLKFEERKIGRAHV